MIQIATSGVTTFAATCSLNATITNPIYLFEFQHKLNNEYFYVIPYMEQWYTSYPPQWNLFNISVDINQPQSLTGNTLSGSTNVWLLPGEYYMKVYQQTSNSNLNPLLSQGMIYKTMAKVDDYCYPEPAYQGTDNEWVVYDECIPTPMLSPSVTPSITPSITPSVTPSATPAPSPTPSPYKMDIGDGFNEDLNGITADGTQFYAFGYFTSYNGYEAENLIRINQDGSVDSSFNSDFYKSTPNAQVYGANAQHPDYVFAWGNFQAYGNPTPNAQWARVVKLNKTDGSLNTNFYTTKPNNDVYDVYVSGTSVWFMGNFTTWNGVSNTRFVQTDIDGNITNSYGTGANSLIRSYVIHDDGDMVIYGDFTSWTGTSVPGIAKINLSTGALDTAFMANIGTGGAFSSKPRAIAKGASGKLYVSYPQNTWNGVAASRLVILNTDGSVDTSFSLPNSGGEAYSLLVDEANDWIYYTGTINEVGGNTRYWGRWIISTSTCDTTFTGIASRYDTINQSPYLFQRQIYKDAQGRIYLAGRFTLYYNNDTSDFDDFNRIIRVYDDGTINTVSN